MLAGQLQAASAAQVDLQAQLLTLQNDNSAAHEAVLEEQRTARQAIEQAESRMQAAVDEAQRRAATAEDDARRAMKERDEIAAQAARDKAVHEAGAPPPVSMRCSLNGDCLPPWVDVCWYVFLGCICACCCRLARAALHAASLRRS